MEPQGPETPVRTKSGKRHRSGTDTKHNFTKRRLYQKTALPIDSSRLVSVYLCHRKANGKRQRSSDLLFFDSEEQAMAWKKKRAKMEDEIRRWRLKASSKQEQKP